MNWRNQHCNVTETKPVLPSVTSVLNKSDTVFMILWTNQYANKKAFRKLCACQRTACCETRILITEQTSCCETRILIIAQSIFCNCWHTDTCNLKSSSCDTHQLTAAAGLRPILTIATEHCLLQYQPDLLYPGQVQATCCTIHTQKPWTGTAWCIYSSV